MFPDAAPGMGCLYRECVGYELDANLDFDTNGNGSADAGDAYWNDGEGWLPIGARKPRIASTPFLTATGIRFPTCSSAGRMPATSDFSALPAGTP